MENVFCQRKIFFWLWLVSAGGGLAVMVFAFTGAFFRQHCFATIRDDHRLKKYERSSQVLSLDIVAVFLNVSSPTPRFTHRRAEGAFFLPGDSQWGLRRITCIVQLQYVHVLHIILSAIAKWKRNLTLVRKEAMASIWRRSCWKVRCGFFRRSSALFEACFPRWQVLWRERWVVRV